MIDEKYRSEVESRLRSVVARELELLVDDIPIGSILGDQIKADSMNRFEIGFHIEKRYKVHIEDEFMAEPRPLIDYVDYVMENGFYPDGQ